MIEKIPFLGKIIRVQTDLKAMAEETVEVLRNGGGDRLKRACEARKADGR